MSNTEPPKVMLVETIMEGGFMSLDDCKKTLQGCADLPQVKAMISLIEKRISMAREDSEALGIPHQTRDESCGAAAYLRGLRDEISGFLYLPPSNPRT